MSFFCPESTNRSSTYKVVNDKMIIIGIKNELNSNSPILNKRCRINGKSKSGYPCFEGIRFLLGSSRIYHPVF